MAPSIHEHAISPQQVALAKQLHQSLVISDESTVIDDSARKKALAAAKELVATLELPTDVVMRYAWEVIQ